MKVERKSVSAEGIRFSVSRDGKEVGRAYLYLMRNDLHSEPFGLMEDVFISETERGSGLGTTLVKEQGYVSLIL